jgi:hypothetical protein
MQYDLPRDPMQRKGTEVRFMAINVSYPIDNNELTRILLLDSLVYPSEQQGDRESIWQRYLSNTNSFTLIKNEDETIGYLCAFPIDRKIYDRIRSGSLPQDSTLEPRHILAYESGRSYDLYIISVVIHPDYQGSGALKHLLWGFLEKLESLQRRGVQLERIMAQAISPKGLSLTKSLGFAVIRDNGQGTIIMEAHVRQVIDSIHQRLDSWSAQRG